MAETEGYMRAVCSPFINQWSPFWASRVLSRIKRPREAWEEVRKKGLYIFNHCGVDLNCNKLVVSLLLYNGCQSDLVLKCQNGSISSFDRMLAAKSSTSIYFFFFYFLFIFNCPAGFWRRAQNTRRHPRSPCVYTYKDKKDLLKK